MRTRRNWDVSATRPAKDDILARQGVPAGVRPTEAHALAVERALGLYDELAAPQAVSEGLGADEFRAVFYGDGRNGRPNPIELLYPRARLPRAARRPPG